MTRSRTAKVTLAEAANEAWRRRLLRRGGFALDFYVLSHSDLEALDELRARTRWRQSQGSSNAGHSPRYAFYNALVRVPRQQVDTRTSSWRQADDLFRRALTLMTDDQHAESADTFEIAADAYSEADDHRGAMVAEAYAREARERARRSS